MTLTPGTRLGQYEIVSEIGAGGMGEVYKARDTKLNRDVAIKVLPPAFAQDRDRLARFEREAQSLAALNHPHIAQIYGVVELPPEGGSHVPALVMEFADGEDLAARLSRGAIPLNEALPLAIQIAAALEAAHERGIIHRDLKPANIKVTESGAVKVLDFGLAKAMAPEASGVAPGFSPATPVQESPTFTSPAMTQMGVILGTAAYMAPEQAKGKAVDRRADVWAFGGVLFEMLTGQRAFDGEDVTDVIASIMRAEPDWTALPAVTPPAIRRLLRRCLEKDRAKRLDSMAVAKYEIEEALAAPLAPAATGADGRRRPAAWLPWAVAALMTVAAIAFGVRALRAPATAPAAPLHASLQPPPGTMFTGALALSPDGTRLLFSAAPYRGASSLWIQDLGTGVASPVRQTDGAWAPFWSPDGSEIAFFADEKLKRVRATGGPAQVVASAPNARGGTWTPDGRIIFAADFRGGLQSVKVSGGMPQPTTTLAGKETSHRWPRMLPDGRHLVFLSQTSEGGTEDDSSTIDIVDVDGKGRRTLVRANSSPLYADPGYLLFWRAGALHAQPLDPRTWTVSETARLVADDVSYDQNERVLATAAGERLVFAPGEGAGRIGLITPSWVDRSGKVIGKVLEPADYACGLALSPVANLLAFGRTPPGSNGCDLWLRDLDRGVDSPLTFGGRNEFAPHFQRDGRMLLYGTDTGADGIRRLDVRRPSAVETLFEKAEGYTALDPGGVTRDGRSLIAAAMHVGRREDIIRYDLVEKKVYPVVTTPFADGAPALSPDEKWIAYASDRSGQMEIYVEPVAGGEAWAVSSSGGVWPVWRDDGKELFYLSSGAGGATSRGAVDRLVSVQVLPGPEFRTSAPKELFSLSFAVTAGYVVDRGGQRFLFGLVEPGEPRPLTVLSHWTVR